MWHVFGRVNRSQGNVVPGPIGRRSVPSGVRRYQSRRRAVPLPGRRTAGDVQAREVGAVGRVAARQVQPAGVSTDSGVSAASPANVRGTPPTVDDALTTADVSSGPDEQPQPSSTSTPSSGLAWPGWTQAATCVAGRLLHPTGVATATDLCARRRTPSTDCDWLLTRTRVRVTPAARRRPKPGSNPGGPPPEAPPVAPLLLPAQLVGPPGRSNSTVHLVGSTHRPRE